MAKPLNWRKPTDHPQDDEEAILVANGIGGRYSIYEEFVDSFLLWWAHDEFTFVECKSLEEAIATAEADWQKRVAEIV